MDGELLALRATVGTLMAGHGAGKLFGVLNAGYGIEGTAGFLEGLGFSPSRQWAYVNGASELGAGLGLAAGLLTPVAGAGIVGVMAVAARTAHVGKGPWGTNGGWELPLTYGLVGAFVSFTGPGRFSLDRALGLRLSGTKWGLGAIALGLGSAAAALAIRKPPAPEPATTPETPV